MKRPVEAADITAVYEHFIHTAINIVNEGTEELIPLVFTAALDEKPGDFRDLLAIPPELVQHCMSSQDGKAALLGVIRNLLDPAMLAKLRKRADIPLPAVDMVVQVLETWVLQQQSQEAYEKHLKGYKHGDLSVHPDRKEAIVVTVHTALQTYLGLSYITRDAAGKATATYSPIEIDMTARGVMTVDGDAPLEPRH